ncbi:MAG: DUF1501 domain-containing protein [Pseudomonadota bacterium]
MTTRRDFLRSVGSTALVASTTGLASTLAAFPTRAASLSGEYRAMVCVFLFGGLDNHDVVLPYDQASYGQFIAARPTLIAAQGSQRQRENLLAISPLNGEDYGTRQFALPPEMPGLHGLFNQGDAAIVGNVGPLIQPTTFEDFENESVPLPPRLFSHNDQQSTWQASVPEGAQFGWGGKFADAVLAGGANGAAQFTAISSANADLFLTGQVAQPYQVSVSGAATIDLLDDLAEEDPALATALKAHFRAEAYAGTNLIGQDIAAKQRQALDSNEMFNQAKQAAIPLGTEFPESELGAQLRAVAEAISVRDLLQAQRQIYFVGLGGFDTHSEQAPQLPALLGQIDGAVSAFCTAMGELGLGDKVTLFTASDFGRTLAVNGDGTDHGWGGHHFVVGQAVNGNRIFGDIPPPVFGHAQDSGSGRLIPTVAVEQYAAALGSWFGLSEGELLASLPNLPNFSGRPSLFG